MSGWKNGSSTRGAAIALAMLSFAGPGAASTPAAGDQAPYFPETPLLRLESGMHLGPVRALDTTPDGRYAVTGGDDATVRVWRLPQGTLERVLHPPITGSGHEGKIYSLSIHPDGRRIAVAGWTGCAADHGRSADCSVYLFDRISGRMGRPISNLPRLANRVAFSADGQLLAVGLYGGAGLQIFRTSDYKQVFTDDAYEGTIVSIEFAADGRLAVTALDRQVRLYSPDFKETQKRDFGKLTPFQARFSPDGTTLAVGLARSTQVMLLDGGDLAYLGDFFTGRVNNGGLHVVGWDPFGERLFAGGRFPQRQGLRRQLLAWGSDRSEPPNGWLVAGSTISGIDALPDGKMVYTATDPLIGLISETGAASTLAQSGAANFRNVYEGSFSLSKDGHQIAFGTAYDGEQPAYFDLRNRTLSTTKPKKTEWHTPTIHAEGLVIEGWHGSEAPTLNGKALTLRPNEIARSLALAPSGEGFLLGSEWRLRYFTREGEVAWEQALPAPAWGVNLSGDGRLAVAALGDGTLRWYRQTDGTPLLTLFPHRDRKRWVAWTPEGFYAASPGGDELVGWLVNQGANQAADFFEVGRFRDYFYRPARVAAALEVQAGSPPEQLKPTPSIAKLLPPVVTLVPEKSRFTTPEQRFTLRIDTPSGEAVESVEFKFDGRPPPPGSLPDGLPTHWNPGEEYRVTLHLPPHDLQVSVIAKNRYTWSEPAVVPMRWSAAADEESNQNRHRGEGSRRTRTLMQEGSDRAASRRTRTLVVTKKPLPSGPRLYVLAIGVSNYAEDSTIVDLDYPAKDATDLSTLIEHRQESTLYQGVEIQTLKDASRSQVESGLQWLAEHVGFSDVVVLFLSGHGFEREGDYFFVPTDALRSDLHTTAVPYLRLQRALRDLPGKVILMLDTCHAGNVMGGDLTLPDVARIANDLRSAENGVLVLTSSTGAQTSIESPEWENGVFTEALLAGLSGLAAPRGESVIYMWSLASFVARTVERLASEATGGQHQQTPTLTIPKTMADFPVLELN